MTEPKLAINPKTARALENYLENPSQVLAVVGPPVSGKGEIAEFIAGRLLGLDSGALDNYPYFFRVTTLENKRDISIDSVRLIIKELKAKVPGHAPVRRIVLIESAYKLSPEAQNALLKTLEQPNPETVFILTLNSSTGVLPTILSRAQRLSVYPVSLEQARRHYPDAEQAELESAWMVSQGSPAELNAILTGQADDIKDNLAIAREFLYQDTYHRLLSLNSLSKSRETATEFLNVLAKLLQTLHHANVKKNKPGLADRLLSARKLTSQTTQSVSLGGSTKLALLNLIINLNL